MQIVIFFTLWFWHLLKFAGCYVLSDVEVSANKNDGIFLTFASYFFFKNDEQ